MTSRSAIEQWANHNPKWPASVGAVGFANMYGGTAENKAVLLRLGQMKMGAFNISNVAVVSREPGIYEDWMNGAMTSPIIGAIAGNILRDFRVEIDYRRGITYLHHKGESADTDLTAVGLIVAIANNGESIVTGVSSTANQKTRESVQPGDRIMGSDGRTVTGSPLAVIAGLFSGMAGEIKQLGLKRKKFNFGGSGICGKAAVANPFISAPPGSLLPCDPLPATPAPESSTSDSSRSPS